MLKNLIFSKNSMEPIFASENLVPFFIALYLFPQSRQFYFGKFLQNR